MEQQSPTSARPYLIRAIYEWIVDNGHTPYITVDTTIPLVTVPGQYIKNNSITLDISATAALELLIDKEAITFKARFAGIPHNIYIPIAAVVAIYAAENGQGMGFPKEEIEKPLTKTSKPQFKIVPGGKD